MSIGWTARIDKDVGKVLGLVEQRVPYLSRSQPRLIYGLEAKSIRETYIRYPSHTHLLGNRNTEGLTKPQWPTNLGSDGMVERFTEVSGGPDFIDFSPCPVLCNLDENCDIPTDCPFCRPLRHSHSFLAPRGVRRFL